MPRCKRWRCDGQVIAAGTQSFGLAEDAGGTRDVDRLDTIEHDQHDVAGRNRGIEKGVFQLVARWGIHSSGQGEGRVRRFCDAERISREIGIAHIMGVGRYCPAALMETTFTDSQ